MTLEDNTEAEAEKAKQEEAGKAAESVKDEAAAPESKQPDPQKGADVPADDGKPAEGDELAKWKAMSRKNEDRASANLKAFQSAEAELAKVRTENAYLIAKSKYPQLTDEALSLCSEKEPDKIAAWAEKYASLNPVGDPKPVKTEPTEDALARKVAMQAEYPSGTSHPKAQSGDAYKRAMERQKARRSNKK